MKLHVRDVQEKNSNVVVYSGPAIAMRLASSN